MTTAYITSLMSFTLLYIIFEATLTVFTHSRDHENER